MEIDRTLLIYFTRFLIVEVLFPNLLKKKKTYTGLGNIFCKLISKIKFKKRDCFHDNDMHDITFKINCEITQTLQIKFCVNMIDIH